jgi:3-dehydroquinate synthetase
MGVLSGEDAERQRELLARFDLPLSWRADPTEVASRLALDKKRAGATQRWILAEGVGRARVRDDVPDELAREAIVSVTQT